VRRFGSWSGGGGCSMMSVDGFFFGSRSSWISMTVVILVVALVQGMKYARGCGFRGLFGKTLVPGFFSNGSVPSKMPKMWLTCAPNSMVSSGRLWRSDLFFCSNCCISSSSSESLCSRASSFLCSGPELGASLASLSFFLSISVGKM
jgi:hypothetical protein